MKQLKFTGIMQGTERIGKRNRHLGQHKPEGEQCPSDIDHHLDHIHPYDGLDTAIKRVNQGND